MIEHLRQREKALEQFGWTGREAEWIALVCLHSGVFTRAQFCHYFEYGSQACAALCQGIGGVASGGGERNPCVLRGSQAVPDIQQADLPGAGGRAYPPPAKGAPRGHDSAAPLARFRSGTSGHAPWLPTEPEKVEFFEEIGLDRRLLRADRVLQVWAAPARWKPGEELTVKQEMKRIHDAIHHDDGDVLAE